MARYLKRGQSPDIAAREDARVRATVERIIDDIGSEGDRALREYSQRFDRWSPASFRLDAAAIEACRGRLSDQVIDDIRFAQAPDQELRPGAEGTRSGTWRSRHCPAWSSVTGTCR